MTDHDNNCKPLSGPLFVTPPVLNEKEFMATGNVAGALRLLMGQVSIVAGVFQRCEKELPQWEWGVSLSKQFSNIWTEMIELMLKKKDKINICRLHKDLRFWTREFENGKPVRGRLKEPYIIVNADLVSKYHDIGVVINHFNFNKSSYGKEIYSRTEVTRMESLPLIFFVELSYPIVVNNIEELIHIGPTIEGKHSMYEAIGWVSDQAQVYVKKPGVILSRSNKRVAVIAYMKKYNYRVYEPLVAAVVPPPSAAKVTVRAPKRNEEKMREEELEAKHNSDSNGPPGLKDDDVYDDDVPDLEEVVYDDDVPDLEEVVGV